MVIESNPRPPGARLIKSAQAARLAPVLAPLELRDVQREADEMIESARRKAAETIRAADETAARTLQQSATEAAAKAEQVLREARERGLEEGREEGRRQVIEQSLSEARERFATQAASAVKMLDELAADWQSRRRMLFVDAREDVTALAIAIVRRIAPRLGDLD